MEARNINGPIDLRIHFLELEKKNGPPGSSKKKEKKRASPGGGDNPVNTEEKFSVLSIEIWINSFLCLWRGLCGSKAFLPVLKNPRAERSLKSMGGYWGSVTFFLEGVGTGWEKMGGEIGGEQSGPHFSYSPTSINKGSGMS